MYADISCSETPAPRLQRAEGSARLVLHRKDGATRLAELYQSGCAKIRLPARANITDTQEAILINTAGGLTGGDRFATEVLAARGTDAIVTTQACERIYRSTGEMAEVTTHLNVESSARLAWLPQETILFNGGRLKRELRAQLETDSELLILESVLLGRQAMNETVQNGVFRDRWRIRRNGRLIFADDVRLDGHIAAQTSRACTLGSHMAMATLLLVSPDAETLLDPLRETLGDSGDASAFGGKLVARLTAPDSLALRRVLEPALAVLLRGRPLPKVWKL